ncbi:hypothetical protein ACET3X_006395 [Alternaria dauci]|uniref:Uncharacterized protein n=1 Tax=Alternaria dauci TaxID=48095 RepID=A0ABR3UFG9_9PLEO
MSKRERKESKTSDDPQQHETTRLKATPFPFLRLPAELRNLIYTHVFSGNIHVVFDGICPRSLQESNLGLLLVSRQVHAECALLPYELSTFDLGHTGYEQFCYFVQERTEQQWWALEDMFEHWEERFDKPLTEWFEYFECDGWKEKWWSGY